MPLAGPWLEHVFALHLQQVLRSDALTQEQRRSGRLDDTQQAVVAFADLVGFTELGEQLPVEELGSVAGRLSHLAGEALEPSVKLVKLIGDAVMLVSPEPEPMVESTLRLVEIAERRRRLPAAARRDRLRAGRAPLGRLVRHAREPGEPPHHPRPALDRARVGGGPRGVTAPTSSPTPARRSSRASPPRSTPSELGAPDLRPPRLATWCANR